MREPLEQRLDEWGGNTDTVSSEPGAFLDTVARVRRRRGALRAGVATGVTTIAVAAAFVLRPGAPTIPLPAPAPRIAADTTVAPAANRSVDQWTLASLSRRMTDTDLSTGGDLLPGGWSMGWASGSPL